MITLYDKRTNLKTIIYKIEKNKSGYVDFLVRRNGQWWWDSAKHYITEEEHQQIMDLELKKEADENIAIADIGAAIILALASFIIGLLIGGIL